MAVVLSDKGSKRAPKNNANVLRADDVKVK